MCFPGGKRDPADADDIATALREAQVQGAAAVAAWLMTACTCGSSHARLVWPLICVCHVLPGAACCAGGAQPGPCCRAGGGLPAAIPVQAPAVGDACGGSHPAAPEVQPQSQRGKRRRKFACLLHLPGSPACSTCLPPQIACLRACVCCPQVAAVFTVPLRRFLEAGPGYSSKDVEWQPGVPYR